jgi:hypothetical protein
MIFSAYEYFSGDHVLFHPRAAFRWPRYNSVFMCCFFVYNNLIISFIHRICALFIVCFSAGVVCGTFIFWVYFGLCVYIDTVGCSIYWPCNWPVFLSDSSIYKRS